MYFEWFTSEWVWTHNTVLCKQQMDTLALPCAGSLSVTLCQRIQCLNGDVSRCNGSGLRNTPRCGAQLGNSKNVPTAVEFEAPVSTQDRSF